MEVLKSFWRNLFATFSKDSSEKEAFWFDLNCSQKFRNALEDSSDVCRSFCLLKISETNKKIGQAK